MHRALAVLLGCCIAPGLAEAVPADDQPPQITKREESAKIKQETPYYVAGAKIGGPPSGTLKAGTLVTTGRAFKTYVFIKTKDGQEGWIEREALETVGGGKKSQSTNPRVVHSGSEAADSNAVDANNEFACRLYQLAAAKPGNVFFSPASIESILGILLEGAGGSTKSAIAEVMSPSDPSQADGIADALLSALNKSKPKLKVSTANHLWIAQGLQVKDSFENALQQHFNANFDMVDFNEPKKVLDAINRWVHKETNGKIPMLFDQPLPAQTRLVAANAIYFNGVWDWKDGFRKAVPGKFYASGEDIIDVKMMSVTEQFKYAPYKTMQLIELPYMGDEFSAVVILPGGPDDSGPTGGGAIDLSSLEQNLSSTNLRKWLNHLDELKPKKVVVGLPKFRMSERLDLTDLLGKLGMGAAFETTADFSGISDEALSVSQAAHRAAVDVNETGTEAAAASGAAVRSSAGTPAFIADHPFLFLIRERSTGLIVFLGRVVHPQYGE